MVRWSAERGRHELAGLLSTGDVRERGAQLAQLTAVSMRHSAEIRDRLAETYRRLAARAPAPLAQYYLGRAQHMEYLARRARHIAQREEIFLSTLADAAVITPSDTPPSTSAK